MKYKETADYITHWLRTYAEKARVKGFVVGISGGIDSAVTSTLCAKTGLTTRVLTMPIRQGENEYNRGHKHMQWLADRYPNVTVHETDLTPIFEKMEGVFPIEIQDYLTMANTRARLRMLTLYAYATHNQLLVAGTGNKVEDFGVGFYTKYGDGGVDVSPIADLYKTQVYALGKELGIIEEILHAPPTDGLFADGRTDEEQIGATYAELEWAMEFIRTQQTRDLSDREKTVMDIYLNRHRANQHKMNPIPVCILPDNIKYSCLEN
jgi:NAD+ synthase